MSRTDSGKFPALAFEEHDAARVAPPPDLDPPFEIFEPERLSCPLVFSSPHSGRAYPAELLAASKLDALTLRRSEDAHVDDLFRGVIAFGAPLICANFPRAYLDLNREPYELDPRMFEGRLPAFANTRSVRVAGGLGTIARIVGESHEIYARRLPVSDAMRRIEALYKPYHRALRGLIQRALNEWRRAVLIDCHSMPSYCSYGDRVGEKTRADIVLGDRYGTSCFPRMIETLERELRLRGYVVQRNNPYAGGFITEHYGNPAMGAHAIQIEVNRGLYLNEATLTQKEDACRVAEDLVASLAALSHSLAAEPPAQSAAAE